MSLKLLIVIFAILSACYCLDSNFISRHKLRGEHLMSSTLTIDHKTKQPIHTCIQDSLQDMIKEHIASVQAYDNQLAKDELKEVRMANAEGTTWQPIRLHFDYSGLNGLNSQYKSFIMDKIMPPAKAYFESVFQVKRLTQPIELNTYYKSNKCGKFPVASSLFSGIKADMILMVFAENMGEGGPMAYASYCDQGSQNTNSKRPVLGYFNINTYMVNEYLSSRQSMWFEWIDTVIHEIMHSFGFSQSQIEGINKNLITKQNGRYLFQGQNVINFGKKYFNCNNLAGVAMEEGGGSGSAGASHWERVSLGNEGMTASVFGNGVFSQFTLSLFLDLKTYNVNMDLAQTLVWGYQEGCSVALGTCLTSVPEHTCTSGTDGCNHDYIGLGPCITTDKWTNNCPYRNPYSNFHCQTMTDQDAKNLQLGYYGGENGRNSRCWSFQGGEGSCFRSKCENQKVQIYANQQWQTCNSEGQLIAVKGGKKVICPSYVRFCGPEAACPNSCNGLGTCSWGKCQCYKGFSGEDCTGTVFKPDKEKEPSAGTDNGKPNCKASDTYYDYQGGRCCNTSSNICCPLRATLSSDSRYCECIPGTYFVNNSCEY